MKRIVLGVLLLAGGLSAVSNAGDEPRKTRKLHGTYTAIVKDIPEGAEKLAVWIPLPSSDAHQDVSSVSVDAGGDGETRLTREREYGNQAVYLAVDRPEQSVRLEVKFDVVRREHVNRSTSGRDKEQVDPRWLQPDRLVPLDEQVRALAQATVGERETPFEKARAIYDHTVSTMQYDKSGTGWGRGDIHFACDAKRGNCTDFHAVFIGFCRAARIPARFHIGFSIPEDAREGEVAGYHCWAEFHVEGAGWIPVDASEARRNPRRRDYYFGAHDANRVRFSTGRDIRLEPPQQGERLNFFIDPYAEVDGRPHAALERSFRFEDLEQGPP